MSSLYYKLVNNRSDTDIGNTPSAPRGGLTREVLASSRRDEWLAACHVALDAILAWPDNSLVSISVPRALGISPARCVTQYVGSSWMWQPASSSRSATASRFATVLTVGINRSYLNTCQIDGFTGHIQTSSSVVDDLVIKMLLADAAGRDRCLVASSRRTRPTPTCRASARCAHRPS